MSLSPNTTGFESPLDGPLWVENRRLYLPMAVIGKLGL